MIFEILDFALPSDPECRDIDMIISRLSGYLGKYATFSCFRRLLFLLLSPISNRFAETRSEKKGSEIEINELKCSQLTII